MLRSLGEEVTEVLDYVPGSFRVTRHVRPKLWCRSCEAIAQAPAPSPPLPCAETLGRSRGPFHPATALRWALCGHHTEDAKGRLAPAFIML